MNASAPASCSASSRVRSRTSTFVSTDRTASLHELCNSRFHLPNGPSFRGTGKQGPMDVFGRVTSRLADDDSIAVLIPFEDRARTDAEPTANFRRNGNLTLCGKSRVRQRHEGYYHGNAYLLDGLRRGVHASNPGRRNFLALGKVRSTSVRSAASSSATCRASASPVASAMTFHASSERSIESSATFAEPFQSF